MLTTEPEMGRATRESNLKLEVATIVKSGPLRHLIIISSLPKSRHIANYYLHDFSTIFQYIGYLIRRYLVRPNLAIYPEVPIIMSVQVVIL